MPALEICALNTENVRSTRMTVLPTANANQDILENIATSLLTAWNLQVLLESTKYGQMTVLDNSLFTVIREAMEEVG